MVSHVHCHDNETVQRICNDGNGVSEAASKCLDVIASSFSAQSSTSLYLADPAAKGFEFWRTMAEEVFLMQPNGNTALYAFPSTSNPYAAALAYRWRPGITTSLPRTEAMIRHEALKEWESYDSLWEKLLSQTYDKYGEFINIDFVAASPEHAREGMGHKLLDAILYDADLYDMAVFLEASGPVNQAWYARHGFGLIHHFYSTVRGLPGHAELAFMVRPGNAAASCSDCRFQNW